MNQLRVIFAGTPDFAAAALESLIAANYNVIAVYTQPDRPAGRGRKLQASPVKQTALQHDIAVYQPQNFKQQETVRELDDLDADVMIVAAYGLILPQAVLDVPKYGCLNIHASILPRWRGAAPIQRAIAAGDTETGITIMQMDAGLDTGDMLLIERCEITATDTGGNLHDRLAALGASSILKVLSKLENGDLTPVKQDNNLANYAHKLNKEEAEIDWSQEVTAIFNHVRAFNPWPVCYTRFNDQTFRIWEAEIAEPGSPGQTTAKQFGTIIQASKQGIDIQCGEGVLRILRLQPAGSKAMDVASFINGHARLLPVGTRFDLITKTTESS